jgi:hypothetical protein
MPNTPRRRLPRPSPALVIAALALFVALGAPGYAASVVDRALFAKRAGTAKKARYATRAGKVDGFSASSRPRPRRLLALDKNGKFPASVGLTGPTGPRGVQGPQGIHGERGFVGAPGSALGYARIFFDPPDEGGAPEWRADDVFSKRIDNDVNFTRAAAGVFCFHDLPFDVSNAVATVGGTLSTKPFLVTAAFGATGASIPAGCNASADARKNAVLYVYDTSGVTPVLSDPVEDVNEIYVAFN